MNRIIHFLLLLVFLSGCHQEEYKLNYKDTGEIIGLASPILLQPEATTIYLGDYFIDPGRIDSVSFNCYPDILLSDNNDSLVIIDNEDLPGLIEIKCWIENTPYSILGKKSKKEYISVYFDPKGSNYNIVQLKGTMNGWNPNATNLELIDGKWQTQLLLNPGSYQYKFVVDGAEAMDPANPDSVDNNFGGFNSVMTVGNIDKQNLPVLYTEKANLHSLTIGLKNHPAELFVFWQNFRLPDRFIKSDNNSFIIQIPEQARGLERSFIRIRAYNNYGVSNEVLIPLHNGKVIQSTSELNRFDHHTKILYNVFVDRFYNGDPDNDEPVDDPEILPKANHFGGDITGITQKIKDGYFDDLGVNTIWISPLVQNPKGAFGLWPEPRSRFSGYHGYWPVSFTQIDYRFGTDDDFRELVNTAHEHGLNVLLDIVANHVHKEHPVYIEHPDWATDLYLPDGSLNTERWDEYRLTTWFDVFLPTLDLAKPEVYEMLSDSAVYWIKEFNLDGFRHDATKHIPEVFWRTLTRKLKEQVMIPEDKSLYQIGETYGNAELISSYVSSGQLDAQFDFNVYDAAIAVFGRDQESFIRLNTTLEESLEYYGDHNLMGYITGNQDRPRFISLAGGALGYEEDSKLAGWTREIGVGDPVGYQKLLMLTAFNMSIPGLPVIYFGDEIGDPGGNDPDNRRMMRFDNLKKEEQNIKETTQKLISIRNNNMAMIYGDIELLLVSDRVYAFARTYFDKIAVVVFSKEQAADQIEIELPERFSQAKLKAHFGNSFNKINNKVNIELKPNTFEILTN